MKIPAGGSAGMWEWSVEACVEGGFDGFSVHVSADEYEFYHSVAYFVVPVACEAGFVAHEDFEFFGGCGGVPVAGFGDAVLHAGLLEEY